MTDQGEMPTPEGEMPTPEPQAEIAEAQKSDEVFDQARAMALIHKLRDENREFGKVQKRLEAFEQAEQERKQAEMTELEKANQKAAQLEAELRTLRLKELQRKAAREAGLPLDLAERLQGETLDDLQADAAELAKVIPKSTKTPPPVPPTNPGPAARGGETDDQRRARLLGIQTNPFDTTEALKHGGGVVWKQSEE